jgi:nicotinate-nucleotide pyrophosphorylase (carboxylating)
VLIKDNHLAALRLEPPNAIEAAVRRAREKYPKLEVEVEADTLEQVEQALLAKADVILLDNMSNEDLRAAVWLVNGRARPRPAAASRWPPCAPSPKRAWILFPSAR